jgi:hypothetical protein
MGHAGFGSATPEVRILPAGSSSLVYGAFPDTTYHFRVFAVTDTRESEPSNEVVIATPEVFFTPTGVSALSEAPTQAVVSWGNVVGESGYRVEVSADGGSTWSTAAETGVDQLSALISGLTPDTEYLFRVLGVYAYGLSKPSNPVGIVTLTTSTSSIPISTADCGTGLSFHRTASGVIRVSAYDAGSSSVTLITELGYVPGAGFWTRGSVDDGPTGVEDVGGDGTSIAVDGAGKAHIVAHDRTHNTLRYATDASGVWVATTIDSGAGGAKPRIALNPANGALHVVYQYSSTQLKHLVKAAGQSWASGEIITSQIEDSSMHALAVDATGAVHVVLINSLRELVYGIKPLATGLWTFQTLPLTPATMRPDSVSMALDSAHTPHFAVHDAQEGSLRHLTRVAGSWETEIIDRTAGADVGGGPSLAIHPTSGRLHVSYYDATRRDLRYARKDSNAGWSRRLIDAVGNVGTHASISVDGAGAVAIAYRDETQRIVKLARGTP